MKHAGIIYYTGTGNTLRALSIVSKELVKSGWTVSMTDIGTGNVPPVPGPGDLLILGFPTLGFSPPAHVLSYLERIPSAPTAASSSDAASGPAMPRAAIVCVCGSSAARSGAITRGWSGTASYKAASVLAKSGYKTVASADISYPENWTQVVNPPGGKTSEAMTAAGDAEAESFGADLAAERFHTIKRGFAGKAFGYPVGWIFRNLARKALARMFGSDSSCSGCGLCSRTCPSAAIDMKNGRPVWNLKCNACNRCINACPSRSIQTTTARLVFMGGFNVILMIASWPVAKAIVRMILPGLASGFPGAAVAVFLLDLALAMGLFAAATLVQVGPLDSILQKLERQPRAARFFEASSTKKFRRYLAPGFRPGEKPYR